MHWMPIGSDFLPPISVIPYHMSMYGHATCHRTSMPHFTLAVVTCVTLGLVHMSWPCQLHMPNHPATCHLQRLPRQLYGIHHVCANYVATSVVRSYDLYSQLPCGTVRTIQTTFFCMFGKMNKTQYQDHKTYVWASSSYIRFVSTRPADMSVLKTLWELWFLGLSKPHQAPASKYGSHLPTKWPFGP